MDESNEKLALHSRQGETAEIDLCEFSVFPATDNLTRRAACSHVRRQLRTPLVNQIHLVYNSLVFRSAQIPFVFQPLE